MALAAELAGRAIEARGAGLKAVWGLRPEGQEHAPLLGSQERRAAELQGLSHFGPHTPGGASWGMRGWKGVTRGVAPPQLLQLAPVSVSWSPHMPPCLALAHPLHHTPEEAAGCRDSRWLP